MKSYGQYCPIARTSELFAERWTPIIVRNLLAGCGTFGQLRDGAPGIPKALLAERLALLERHGVVRREGRAGGRGAVYELTEKGRGLQAVCDAMGEWGARWLEIEPTDVDPLYVLWATCRLVDLAKVPQSGVVVRVVLRGGATRRQFWLMLFQPRAELCTSSMGRVEDLVLTTDAETLVQYNLRSISFGQALREGLVSPEGPPRLVRDFPRWIRPSPFAHVRPAMPL